MVGVILNLILSLAMANGNGSPVQGDYAIGLMKPDTNFIINPIAEKNTFGSSVSNASVSRDTDSSEKLYGKASWICDASAQNGYCEFALKSITNPAQAGNCAAYAYVKGDASLYKLQILDGSANVLGSSPVLGNYTEWTTVEATYPCGSSRKVRFTQTESGTGAAVNLGVFYGINQNIGTVAQATYFGGMSNAGASSCNYGESSSSGLSNFVSLSTGSSCAAWTVDSAGTANGITAQGTNDHRLNVANMPLGFYTFRLVGTFYNGFTSGGTCLFRLSDGTNSFDPQSVGDGNSAQFGGGLVFHVPVTSSGAKTFTLQAADNHASACNWTNEANYQAAWRIERYPSQAEQVVRMNQSNFDWTTCPTITGGWSTNTTYSCIWKRQGSNAYFDILVSVSGAPTSANLTLNLPVTIDTTKLSSTNNTLLSSGIASDGGIHYPLLARYESTTSVRALYWTGTPPSLSGVTQAAPFTFGSGDFVSVQFVVPVVGWTENQNAPLIKGGVTSLSSSTMVPDSFLADSSGVVTEIGGADLVSQTTATPASSVYTYTFSRPYTSQPMCLATTVQTASGVVSNTSAPQLTDLSTSGFKVRTFDAGGTGANRPHAVYCWGPR